MYLRVLSQRTAQPSDSISETKASLSAAYFMHSSMVFMSRSFQLWPFSAVWYSAPLMPRACCVGASKTGSPIS